MTLHDPPYLLKESFGIACHDSFVLFKNLLITILETSNIEAA